MNLLTALRQKADSEIRAGCVAKNKGRPVIPIADSRHPRRGFGLGGNPKQTHHLS
jgi:hypothetical protein